VELLFAVSLGATLMAAAIPLVSADVDAARARAATRFLLARVAEARASAVSRGAPVALRFVESATGVSVRSYVDRDGDGVLTADIADGTDTPTGPALELADVLPHVRIGFAGGRGQPDPLVPGRAHLFSFSPTSTATSGSVYVRARDGTQWSVRILGVTARARVARYQAATDTWVDTE